MRLEKLAVVVLTLSTFGCASAAPAAKAICAIASAICPFVAGKPVTIAAETANATCPEGKVLRITNWKKVEKEAARPVLECK